MVQLRLKIGKSWTFDNIFFGESPIHNILKINILRMLPVF